MEYNILIAGFINTVLVLALVQLLKVKVPILKENVPWLLPIVAGGIGPVVAAGQNALFAWLGVPIDLSPIAAIFTGATATAVNQVGKQAAKAAVMILLCLILVTSMTSCAFLKPAGDVKLTEDETARLVVGGFQDASGVLFDAGKMFILAQPQYQGEWKTRIAPSFNQINKFLGGLAAGGSAGLKITPQLVVNQLQTQVMEIVTVYTQWGTVPDAKNEKPTPAQTALIIVAGIQAGTILYDHLVAFSGGKIQTWEAIVIKNTALQAKIEAEK